MFIFIRRFRTAIPVAALLAAAGSVTFAQTAVPAAGSSVQVPSTAPALAGMRPALAQVGEAVASLRIARWKAPEDVRGSSEGDAESIQRDLTATLPPLLDQAQAAGSVTGPLAPSLNVFRNIDALYDVLLRITEMANLAGSSVEATRLEDARAALESARSQLANALLASVTAQDAELTRLRAQAAAAPKPAAAASVPERVVVDDGPETPKHHKKKAVPPPKKKTDPSPAPQ